MGETDIRKIEKEIDIFHKGHSAYNYSKATAILNLLRSFEDGCRLMGPIEMALTSSKEMMEMNNRFFLDAIDMAIKWVYSECKDDNSIDFTCDDRYLTFSFLLMYNAKPYTDICSAYISYSRGYFSATVKDNKVFFSINKPVPKIIHADYSVEIKNKNSRYNLELIEIMSDFKKVKDETISQIRIEDGHVNYTITPNIWAKTKRVLEYQFNSSREIPGDWIIDGFTLDDYSNIWITLATWMMVHSTSCYFSGITGGALQDVVLTKSFDEIIQFIGNRTDIDEAIIRKIISLLVFDPKIRNNDVIYQPIIRLTTELYALSPNLFLNSSPERNLISIVNKYQDKKEYSTFTNKRESLMAEVILSGFNNSGWYVKPSVNIPSPFPDIDLLILDIVNNAVLLCELKWLSSADSTSEVYARQDDIDKGVEQSEITIKYFKENLLDGLSRAYEKTIIDKVDIEKVTIGACVISMNTIRTTLDSIPVINIDQFTELCKKDGYNLKTIINQLEQRSYLSGLPDKYSEVSQKIEYAGYTFEIPAITFNPIIHSEKVGRNDPCPCGKVNPLTGKPIKYKKCCGENI